METTGSKPTGVKGTLAGMIMNLIHANQYGKIIQRHLAGNLEPAAELSILDVGCGGGKAISIFSSIIKKARIYGIDHSMEMVKLSGKINRKGIANGQIEIVQGTVNNLPFASEMFDIATAFDTISFWNDMDNSINEVKRVLKHGGLFSIVNGYPAPGTKWYDIVKFKNADEYRAFLTGHGFRQIEIVIEKNTIIIKAFK